MSSDLSIVSSNSSVMAGLVPATRVLFADTL
jgi:hypothetical protein